MVPEKGDKSIHVNVEDVCKAYLEVGAQPGDMIFMHGSLSSMGTVDGGPATIFNGMLRACGPCGTIGMPCPWFQKAGMEEKDFDVETSPTWVGAMAEAMRNDYRRKRSNHFTHSVCAIGSRAEELTKGHGAFGPRPSPWSETAFADCSPWRKLIDWNALYTFIGVNSNSGTLKHWIEGEIVLHYLKTVPESRRSEARMELQYERNQKGTWLYYDGGELQAELERMGIVKKTKLGSATLTAMRTRPWVTLSIGLMLAEPQRWFTKEQMAWIDGLKKYQN